MRKKNQKILSLFIIFALIAPSSFVFSKNQPIQDIKNILTNEDKYEKVKQYLEKSLKDAGVAGYSYSIFTNKKIIQEKYYGVSDNRKDKINRDTVFSIASLSKSFTALSIMQLYERGKLDIKDPLIKYIPEISFNNDDRVKSITILNLLNQTSGISSIDGLKISKQNITKENILAATNNANLNNKPGDVFEYSDLNYFILGYIIEKSSGMSYDQYVEKNIIKNFDLKNTFTNESLISKKDTKTSGFQQIFGFIFKNTSEYNIGGLPDSGLISNTNDLSKYYMLYLNNGYYNNREILPKSDFNLMLDTPILDNGKSEYGMGWNVQYKYGKKILSHSGDMTDSHSSVFLIPDENIGFVILVNTNSIFQSMNIESIVDGIQKIIIKDEAPDQQNYLLLLFYAVISVMFIVIIIEIIQLFKIKKFILSLKNNLFSRKYIFFKVILPFIFDISFVLFFIIIYNQYVFDALINIQLDIVILFIILILIPIILSIIKFIIGMIIIFGKSKNKITLENIKDKIKIFD